MRVATDHSPGHVPGNGPVVVVATLTQQEHVDKYDCGITSRTLQNLHEDPPCNPSRVVDVGLDNVSWTPTLTHGFVFVNCEDTDDVFFFQEDLVPSNLYDTCNVPVDVWDDGGLSDDMCVDMDLQDVMDFEYVHEDTL